VAPLRDALEAACVALGGAVNGAGARAPHVVNASFAGWNGAELVAALDLEGVSASSGSACSAGTIEPSPVIAAMHGEARARSAVRFSLGEATTRSEIDRAIDALRRVMNR
jgi:cysteine desulfurase